MRQLRDAPQAREQDVFCVRFGEVQEASVSDQNRMENHPHRPEIVPQKRNGEVVFSP